MMRSHGISRGRGGALAVGMMLAGLACGLASPVSAQTAFGEDPDIGELITQVGEEYAVSYASPLLYSFGPNVNANLYSSAQIPWHSIVFGIGVKAMGTQINETDQYFSKVIEDVDLSQYDPNLPAGTIGDVYMSGPTVFGSKTTNGRVQGFYQGTEVFNLETIPGLLDSRWSPMILPEAYIGGVAGLKLTVRYLPEYEDDEYGKTKYFGYGVSWNVNGLLTGLPLDVMVGFFNQDGDYKNVDYEASFESSATSIFAAASKEFTLITVYGGFALEDSKMDVSYQFVHPTDPALDTKVAFSVDGVQDSRFTLGASLNFLARLNIEAGFGNKMTTYSAGLMFGL